MKVLNKVVQISIYDIVPNKNQPREKFDDESLIPLAASIKENGIFQPLSVKKVDKQGKHEIIAGERRFRAAKMAYLTSVPCIIYSISEEKSALLALIENIQREDLNFFEEAKGIEKLIISGMTQTELAKSLGKAQSTIANKLRILKLEKEEIELILKYNLTERHARALLKIENSNKRKAILNEIIKKNLKVSESEKLIEKINCTYTKKENKRIILVRDVRLFCNTINHAIDIMKQAGIEAEAEQTESYEFIEYKIKIPLIKNEIKTLKKRKEKIRTA